MRKRLVDLTLYVVIAVAVGGAVVWYGLGDDPTKGQYLGVWFGFLGHTAVLYRFVVGLHKPQGNDRRFWIPLALSLIAHLVCFCIGLERLGHWRLWWFFLMYPVEIPIIMGWCYWWRERFGAGEAEGR